MTGNAAWPIWEARFLGGPILLLWRRVRSNTTLLLIICIAVNIGMWLERFNIVVTSLAHDRLPFDWRVYVPTWVEWAVTFGALGWFFFLFLVGCFLFFHCDRSLTSLRFFLGDHGDGMLGAVVFDLDLRRDALVGREHFFELVRFGELFVLEAFEQGVGIRPLLTRVGGSIPLMPALTEKGIDTILTGFGLPESNIHSPNERFLVPYFAAGIDTAAALFTALGRLN